MHLYIWEYVSNVTGNWHDKGGLVVVADSLEDARELLKGQVMPDCGAFEEDPDSVYTVDSTSVKKVVLFPDAGCC